MGKFLVKRLLQMIPLLIGISVISFLIIHSAPGDPTSLFFNPKMTALDIDRIRANFGLDQPLHIQYFKWVWSFLRGDFGTSFLSGRPVAEEIADRLPATLLLTGTSLVIAFGLAIPIGVISAVRQYSWIDHLVTLGSLFGVSMPVFWFGLMTILVFSVQLGWLPTSGMYTLGEPFSLADRIKHLAMPALVLGIDSIAGYSRYVRSSMVEIIRQDYVRTARAKGLSEQIVIYKHALRNAMIPVVTLFGMSIPMLVSGAVVTETIFAWPGLGRLMITAAGARDYPVLMALTVLSAVAVVIGNFIADLLYALVDPRVRYS